VVLTHPKVVKYFAPTLSIVGSLLFIYQMVRAWVFPELVDISSLEVFGILMWIELLLLFTGLSLLVVGRTFGLVIVLAFLGFFWWQMLALLSNQVIIISFALVIIGRLFPFSFLAQHSDTSKTDLAIRAVIGIVMWHAVLLVFKMTADYLPEFGITTSYLLESGYQPLMNSNDEQTESPVQMIASAITYYCCWICLDLKLGLTARFGLSEKEGFTIK